MNPKTTLILAAVLIGGGLLWYFKPGVEPVANKPEQDKPLSETKDLFDPRPKAEEIVRVIIEREGKPRLAFERSGEKDPLTGVLADWRMSEPMPSETDTHTVQGVVSTVIGLQSSGAFKPGGTGSVTLADAGLEKPTGRIKLFDKAGKEITVEVGKKVVMSTDSYVRIDGKGDILVVRHDFSRTLKNEAIHYRGKSLFRNARRGASKLAIEHDGKKYEFAKKEGVDEWLMNEPARAYAVADKVRGIVNGLANIRIDKFVDDTPASLEPFGLATPYLRISLATEEKKPIPQSQPTTDAASQPAEPQFETITRTYGLLVGGFADAASTSRFIKLPDQPWVGTASKDSLEQLIPKDVRDTRITRIKADSVTQIELAVGEAVAKLTLKDGKWTGGEELADLDEAVVRGLLQALEDGKAIDYIDNPESPAVYGLDAPRATLKVTTSGEVEPVTVLIGSNTPSGLNTHVMVAGQSSVQVVRTELASRLAVEPNALRSRAIFSLRPDELRRVERIRGESKMVIARENATSEWKLVEPEHPADPATTRELTNDLALLRARRIVGKADPAKHGLDDPMMVFYFSAERPTATATSQPDAEPAAATLVSHTLKIGRAENLTYCQRDDDPTIFELDDTVFRTFTAELIRRALFDGVFDAKAVSGIRVESNNGTVEFTRDDKVWKYAIDPTVRISAKKLDDFAAELAGMRAESYIAYENADAEALKLQGAVVVTITLSSGEVVTLKVDQARRGELPRVALWVEKGRAFLLRVGDAEKLIRGIDYYAQPEAPEPTEGDAAGPQQPGVRPTPRLPGNP